MGDVLLNSNNPIVYISEPCTHDVQLHGLCALCGKDLTQVDYTGFSDTSRAAISMVHDVGGLTVSLEEASRLETATTLRLKASKKLSLIVDLDQTIVHATVDPTVGEWLQDPSNPNYKALIGSTKRFKLGENEDWTQSGFVGAEGDEEEEEKGGCWYYVKMRPGLQKFLHDVSELYEMHVYTMGTRAYASEVCKIIDPDGGLFGGRILSRDESGSMTRKSLQRLFPCDTSMVVIIDDRADVWDGSPNLVKVVPYEFFVGIGDINAAFLPKKKDLTGVQGPSPSEETLPSTTTPVVSPKPEASTSASAEVSWIAPTSTTSEDISVFSESSPPSSLLNSRVISPSLSEASASTAATIHAQIEDRPLSKTHHDDEDETDEELVLKDDDVELVRIFDILKSIRDEFFVDGEEDSDVKTIIPAMKKRVLQGVNLVFSGIVALGAQPEDSEYWKAATLFGAKCASDLNTKTTHVLANQDGTAKVHLARRTGGIQVVWSKWLLDSISLWSRQKEEPYIIKDPLGNAHHRRTGSNILPPAPESNPPSPSSSNLGDDGIDLLGEIDMSNADWAAARDEVDDFLDETDDEDVNSVQGDGEDDDDDGEASDASIKSSSSNLIKVVVRKRARVSSNDSNEEDRSTKRNGNGNGKGKEVDSSPLPVGSPLQKRVRTSRSRKSRLNLSFPLGEGEDGKEEVEGGMVSISPSPEKPPSSSNSNASARLLEDGGGDDSRPPSESEVDSDDDFLKSMAEELENGWT